MACKEGSTELKNKLYCMYRCRIRCGQTGWGFCWVLQKMLSCSSPSCDLSLTTYMWVPPCVKWFMYMLNKLSHGDFFLRNCGILKSVLVAFFFSFVALSSGKHADGWTLLSLSYLFISPNWTNPITAQAISLLSETSWHVGVHKILITGSLRGCGLSLTLRQMLSKPWSDS